MTAPALTPRASIEAVALLRMRRAADALRADAAGRTCDDCQHAVLSGSAGWCRSNSSLRSLMEGAREPLRIERRGAIACAKFSRRVEPLPRSCGGREL